MESFSYLLWYSHAVAVAKCVRQRIRERTIFLCEWLLASGLAPTYLVAHLELAGHGVEAGHRIHEHARRFAAARLVEVMHRSETGEGDGRDDRVTYTGHLDLLRYPMAELAKAGDGAEGDDVGSAHDGVDVRYGLNELLGAGVACIDAEVSHHVYVDNEDLKAFSAMETKGTKVFIQIAPTGKKIENLDFSIK